MRLPALIESAVALLVVALCAMMIWATAQSLPVANLARLPALGVSGSWFHSAITTFAVLTGAFMLIKVVGLWRTPE